MSKSHIVLTITPKSNVKDMKVQDNSKVRVVNFRWSEEIKVVCWGMMLTDQISAHQVSVRDHYLCLDGEDYRIISFFSGPEDVAGPNGTYTNNRKKEFGLKYNKVKRPDRQEGMCEAFKYAYK